ncbi:MAG: hypothetical protein QS721_04605 [Candidatus Endonucleobacter sp. (ex Gigantidas childressi)]|nr:hypothetical protein [Candidatus Endonucleobacter sp. (ex Gigantidas childressi)]
MSTKLSFKDEAYLCLLCLKNSTERMVKWYVMYIQLRSIVGDIPPLLIAVLASLCTKTKGLQKKLIQSWPNYMQEEKWHDQKDQAVLLNDLSNETQEELRQVCIAEMKLLQLIYIMTNKQ